jgi:hypothetical protein
MGLGLVPVPTHLASLAGTVEKPMLGAAFSRASAPVGALFALGSPC